MSKRSLKQNNSIHLYCEHLAEGLNEGGLDMRLVLKPEVDIPWTKDTVKDFLWRPIQDAMLKKESTTELSKEEVSKVYEVLNRHLAEKFFISIPFPSEEELLNNEL